MDTRRPRPARSPTGLIITLLGLVALIGLLTGALAHSLANRGGSGIQSASATATATTGLVGAAHTPIATASATHTTSATATATTSTSATASDRFQLSVSVSPRTVTAGQQLTITVQAFTPDTHAPIAGLSCSLRAPTDGGKALLAAWPAAQTTNTDGAVTWTLTAPSVATGTYEVEAFAKTSKWSWKADATVSVRGS